MTVANRNRAYAELHIKEIWETAEMGICITPSDCQPIPFQNPQAHQMPSIILRHCCSSTSCKELQEEMMKVFDRFSVTGHAGLDPVVLACKQSDYLIDLGRVLLAVDKFHHKGFKHCIVATLQPVCRQ